MEKVEWGISILTVFILTIITSCSENGTFKECNQETNRIKINIAEKGYTTKGFFSEECELFSSDNDAFFVIRNQSDFIATVDCDQELPKIDFEKYTLLIGQKKLTWCCATALEQEVIKDCNEKKYTYIVKLDDPDGKYQALSTFYHWVIISKVPSDYLVHLQLE